MGKQLSIKSDGILHDGTVINVGDAVRWSTCGWTGTTTVLLNESGLMCLERSIFGDMTPIQEIQLTTKIEKWT